MKLQKVLENLNSFEKNSFLKILDILIGQNPANIKEIERILTNQDKDLKNVDNNNISEVFRLLEKEFEKYVRDEFIDTASQLDILTDILIRDGNCIMKHEWFSRLYEIELKNLRAKLGQLKKNFESEKSEIEDIRRRDYEIYKECLRTAFFNDEMNNQEFKITKDELSILQTLSNSLDLSQEEIKLINYSIIEPERKDTDHLINDLKNIGVLFYSKKLNTVFVPDEVVRVLRRIRGKDVADKFFRRVLRKLKDSQINYICRKHSIDWKQEKEEKIKDILKQGLSLSSILENDIYKNGASLTERKNYINSLIEKELKIELEAKGVTLEEKINNLVEYFNDLDKEDKIAISLDGYEKLLIDINKTISESKKILQSEFEFQESDILKSEFLLDFNIKPRDVLEVIGENNLNKFCEIRQISTRGDIVNNILSSYKDLENLYLENYVSFSYRDLKALKENGIDIKEAEICLKFEYLTKKIFEKLGFLVDEKLRKKLNTKKDKVDIVINLGNDNIILIECKTIKESGFNKFSSVSRQLKSYFDLAKKNQLSVVKSLLVAPEFSDEFVNECGLEYDLNLSLITAESLLNIYQAFKDTSFKSFPYKLLMRDVVIQDDRIIKALKK